MKRGWAFWVAVLAVIPAASAMAQGKYNVKIDAGAVAREHTPVEVKLSKFSGDPAQMSASIAPKADPSKKVPAQLHKEGKDVVADFILQGELKAGASWEGEIAVEPAKKGASTDESFKFVPHGTDYEDLLFGKTPVWRYMTAYDPKDLENTYKVYTHIYDLHGNGYLTKGPGGLYTHHRGLFIGWRKTTALGKEYDTWHMKPDGTTIRNVGYVDADTLAGPVLARRTGLLHWMTPDEKTLIEEHRTITAWRVSPGELILDVNIKLDSKAGDIKLDGDSPHAGFQFRAAQEVADNQKETTYVLPEGKERNKQDDVKADWATGLFPLKGHRYAVEYMAHTSNRNREGTIVNARLYGRWGEFFPTELKAGEPMTMKYRIRIFDADKSGEMTTPRCQAMFDDYVKPVVAEAKAE